MAHDLITYLNSVLRQVAAEAGVQFVDTEAAFDGYKLCEGNPATAAMNGLTIKKFAWGVDAVESFHPNKAGHEKLAAVVAAQTSNLTKPMPEPVAIAPYASVDPNLPLLQNRPVSGRVVYNVQMLEKGDAVVQKGSQLDLVVNAKDYHYLKPESVYEASLHSTPVSLGSFTSDAQGNLTVSATVPATVDPGFHTLHIRGKDIFGSPIDLQRTMYVAASADDYDMDGVQNDSDSCALAAQSGVDKDADGIDDVCDPLVTELPPIPPDPEGVVWREDAVLSIDIQTSSGE